MAMDHLNVGPNLRSQFSAEHQAWLASMGRPNAFSLPSAPPPFPAPSQPISFRMASAPSPGIGVSQDQSSADRKQRRVLRSILEAEVVRLMFNLFLTGDGKSGAMGVKAVTVWLNEHQYRTRVGARWGIGPLHQILPAHIQEYAPLQPEGLENPRSKTRSRANCRRRRSHYRCGDVRFRPGDAESQKPTGNASKGGDRTYPPDRPLHLRKLLGRHDSAHGKVRTLSLLHLRELRPAGQGRLQGPLHSYGQARPPRHRTSRRSPAHTGTGRKAPRGPLGTAGRQERGLFHPADIPSGKLTDAEERPRTALFRN